MRKGALFSGLLHLAVVLVAFFGLPSLFAPTETRQPISVQVVDIADVTTPPKQEKKPAPKPVTEPEPPKPEAQQEPPPAPPVEPAPKPAPPEPEPVIAPPPPEPVPEPEPIPEPEPEVAKAEPLPVPRVKPEPPEKPAERKVVENEPEEPEKEPEERSFTSVLKNVEKLKQRAAAEPEPSPEPTPEAAAEDRNLSSEPLTVSEIDAIRAQIERCWIVDPGMKGIEDITVEIVTTLNPDGSVNQAHWKDQSRYNSDHLYRVVAESARRAVLKCSPLKVPQKKYATWKEVTLVFNAREMLGL